MTYPQDPQGWQQRANDPYGQQPGGYDPHGVDYGDPYAQPGGQQPAFDPTTGQPQQPGPLPPGYEYPRPPGTPPPGTPPPYPTSGQPQYPTSGYPGAPTSGYPGAPTSGYPGAPTSGYPGAPTSGYPGAPTSGYPGAAPTSGYPTSGGYPAQGYQAAGYGGYPPVPPPKKSKTGLILGIAAGVVVLLIIVGSLGAWALFSDPEPDPTPTAAPTTQSPSPSPSPSDPAQLAQFKDPDLREFARRAAGEADRCEVITATIPAANNAAEALKCIYGAEYQVYFLRYKTLADRDSYAQSARTGFNDDSLVVDGDTFWTNDQQVRQGNYITGHGTSDNGRYTYWDVPGKPVSGEVYSTSTDASATETFWRKVR